jgi:hypothetical protein
MAGYQNLEVVIKKRDKDDILSHYDIEGDNVSIFLPYHDYYRSYKINREKTRVR